jgi:hypothetical protein
VIEQDTDRGVQRGSSTVELKRLDGELLVSGVFSDVWRVLIVIGRHALYNDSSIASKCGNYGLAFRRILAVNWW